MSVPDVARACLGGQVLHNERVSALHSVCFQRSSEEGEACVLRQKGSPFYACEKFLEGPSLTSEALTKALRNLYGVEGYRTGQLSNIQATPRLLKLKALSASRDAAAAPCIRPSHRPSLAFSALLHPMACASSAGVLPARAMHGLLQA